MEAIFVSAGIMTTIILSIVGLVKLPFTTFKEKHPKGYKATFTGVSILLTFAVCLFNQGVILAQPLFNTNFIITLLSTYAGVFGLYMSYEGLGAKELIKRLVGAIKEAQIKAKEVKATKVKVSKDVTKAEKYIDRIGLDLATEIINVKKSSITQVDNAIVENQVINAENVEINNSEVHNINN